MVEYNMPTDSQAFMAAWKGKPIDGVLFAHQSAHELIFVSGTQRLLSTLGMARPFG